VGACRHFLIVGAFFLQGASTQIGRLYPFFSLGSHDFRVFATQFQMIFILLLRRKGFSSHDKFIPYA
jgi:hypothetical protein